MRILRGRELRVSRSVPTMSVACRSLLFLFVYALNLGATLSCGSTPPSARETSLATLEPARTPDGEPKAIGVTEEIKTLVELGTPPSLIRALDIIRSRELGGTEFGRAMIAVCVALLQKLYPEIPVTLPVSDPPSTNSYTRILRDAERGSYTPASAASSDYLEHVLPFLSLLNETRPDRLAASLPDLEKAAGLGKPSVLDPYFRGIIAERRSSWVVALAAYDEARAISADCYPAVVGAARALNQNGRVKESVDLLVELSVRYPDSLIVKRELARAYYDSRDWSRAGPAVAEILQREPKDARFLLMRAHVFVETGAYLQAQPLLEALAGIDPTNRLYLFLRARVQAEAYRNRDSALTYLRSLLRAKPDDEEALAYMARLLLESTRPEESAEGRVLLTRLVSSDSVSLMIVDLALKDAMARAAWTEAFPYITRLLEERRTNADLRNAYSVYSNGKSNELALEVARELYERDSANVEAAAIYASALIDSGQKEEAAQVIATRLPGMAGGSIKSRFYFLRSRIRIDEESLMGDLRSSLFEDPRNLDALVAMLEIYRSRKDERRAVYYLKQALALAPEDPKLLKYREEFSAAMTATP